MRKRLFWVALYLWAFAFHSLLWVHIYNHYGRVELAIVTMAIGLLFIWGVFIALVQVTIMKRMKPLYVSPLKYMLIIPLLFVALALLAEVVSTSMTNTAYLWGLSPHDAYITASPNYIHVVTRHSVIVFIPQLIAIALLNLHYHFKAFEWFIIYGLIGYLNEFLAFGDAASAVSIPYWVIIYGWIVYMPNKILLPHKKRIEPKFYHYGIALLVPLLLSIPWVFIVMALLHG